MTRARDAPATQTADPKVEVKDPFLIGPIRFNPNWVQKPYSDTYFRWLVVISCAVWYNLVFILPRAVFHEMQEGSQLYFFLVLDYLCDFLYLLDMVIKMITGYIENGILIKDPMKLMRAYVRNPVLKWDIFSILPLDVLYIYTGWYAPYPIIRINRIFRYTRVGDFYYRAQTRLDSPNTFRLIYLILSMIVIVHLNACIYYFVSSHVGIGLDRWAYPGRAGWRYLPAGSHGASHATDHKDSHKDNFTHGIGELDSFANGTNHSTHLVHENPLARAIFHLDMADDQLFGLGNVTLPQDDFAPGSIYSTTTTENGHKSSMSELPTMVMEKQLGTESLHHSRAARDLLARKEIDMMYEGSPAHVAVTIHGPKRLLDIQVSVFTNSNPQDAVSNMVIPSNQETTSSETTVRTLDSLQTFANATDGSSNGYTTTTAAATTSSTMVASPSSSVDSAGQHNLSADISFNPTPFPITQELNNASVNLPTAFTTAEPTTSEETVQTSTEPSHVSIFSTPVGFSENTRVSNRTERELTEISDKDRSTKQDKLHESEAGSSASRQLDSSSESSTKAGATHVQEKEHAVTDVPGGQGDPTVQITTNSAHNLAAPIDDSHKTHSEATASHETPFESTPGVAVAGHDSGTSSAAVEHNAAADSGHRATDDSGGHQDIENRNPSHGNGVRLANDHSVHDTAAHGTGDHGTSGGGADAHVGNGEHGGNDHPDDSHGGEHGAHTHEAGEHGASGHGNASHGGEHGAAHGSGEHGAHGEHGEHGEGEHEEGGEHHKPIEISSRFENDSLLQKYSYCMYWSVKMMTSKPYELANPTTNAEFIFHIFDAFLGIFMFASIVGEVDGIIERINKSSDDFKEKLDSVKQYISMRKVGREMESRVVKWFDYVWANNGSLDEDSALAVLPENLRMEIAKHVHLDVLKKVPIFQGIDEQFLLELAEKLRFEAFCPGDYVCRKGDIGREIYVVRRGLLNVIAADGVKVIVTLKSGVVFGELSLLNVPGSANGNRRTVTVRTVGYADLFSLSKEAFWTCLEEYPEVKDQLMEKARKILSKDNLLNEEAAREAARRGRNFGEVAARLEENLEIVNIRMMRFWQEQIQINRSLLSKLERLENHGKYRQETRTAPPVVGDILDLSIEAQSSIPSPS